MGHLRREAEVAKFLFFLRSGSLSLLLPFGFFFGELAGGKGGGVGHVDAEE